MKKLLVTLALVVVLLLATGARVNRSNHIDVDRGVEYLQEVFP